ncbi:gliding motility-associated C-terminal domain-containing protein [Mucilaginibacter flavus]|uniref:T9SS type B sorting domain-containing protein n=1 Tax=Mucilaginibacter flavus TaxID=931504 RepID=UPI0025B5D740|nr:gliding motility-associated C-terminal domain-containing protein [Mucilaginibacter flavus]
MALTFVVGNANAQTADVCKGALGDAVVNETFGAGNNFGAALPYTTMYYVSSFCPNDGYYTIANSTVDLNSGGSCHDTWHTVTQDHTGDPNGYFMFINASFAKSVFYTQPINLQLCQKTTYEFSAYVLNLIKLSASNDQTIQPDIKFTIKAPDGTILKSSENVVPPTAGPEWQKFSLFFTTPANINSVIVELSNEAPGGNGNDLLLDDIQFRACGPVIQTGFTTIGANQPQNQCVGQSQNYTLKAQVGDGYTDPALQWQINKSDGNGWVDIAGQTTDTYNFTINNNVASVYQYRLSAAEQSNIGSPECRVSSAPLSVTVNSYPVVPDIPPVGVCEGDAVAIAASGGVAYEWAGPAITNANKNQNPLVIDAAALAVSGNYTVTVTNASGCSVTKSTKITVNPKPVITVANPVYTICKGAGTTIAASSSGAVSYSWTPATGLSDATSATPVATPTDTTVYIVVATTSSGCVESAKVTVNVLPPPIADAGKDRAMFEGQSITLGGTAKNANVYSWTPTTALSDPTILNPVASPTDDITYTLHVSSQYNCGIAESSVFVRVYKKIIVPNSFSPNGDGVNDSWNIEALFTYPESELTVFNRYGQVVFKSKGYDKPWRGTSNGITLPTGTYYYTIDLKNGTPKLSGWVLLVK